jgi:hypothetical protein
MEYVFEAQASRLRGDGGKGTDRCEQVRGERCAGAGNKCRAQGEDQGFFSALLSPAILEIISCPEDYAGGNGSDLRGSD